MTQEFISIPYKQLSTDVLEGIVREFVLREGTDYGPVEYGLDQKIAQVKEQLKAGKAHIVFNPKDESCDIVTTAILARQSPSS